MREGPTEADNAVPPRDAVNDVSLEAAVVARAWKSGIRFDSPNESSGLPSDFPDVFPATDWVAREAEDALCLIGVQEGSTLEPCCKVGLYGFHQVGRGRTAAEGTTGATQREGEQACGGCVGEGWRRASGWYRNRSGQVRR